MATLEERVDVLESKEAIRSLKIEYAMACDDGYDQDRIAECYTEDGVFDAGEFGRHEGREAIRTLFDGQEEVFQFAMHNVLGHSVNVEPLADTATGSVFLLQPCTVEEWLAGSQRHMTRSTARVTTASAVRAQQAEHPVQHAL